MLENGHFLDKTWEWEKCVFIQFKEKNWKVKGLNRWYVEPYSKEKTAIQSSLKEDVNLLLKDIHRKTTVNHDRF